MSYVRFPSSIGKNNKQPFVCEGAGGPTRFFSAVRVHVMVHQGAKDPQSHTNVKHEDDRDAPASRPERHLTLPLKTPPGGGRVEPVREPQPAFAHSSTMRRPAGASRCHTYFSRNGRGRRGRTNRSATCSARQGVGARLHCHRCGSRVPRRMQFGLLSSPGTGRLWGARRLRNGPDGLVRARRCNTVIGVVRYDLMMKRYDSQRRGRPLRVQPGRQSGWMC